jgi:head-tail adaptor
MSLSSTTSSMQSGKLNKRLVILKQSSAQDEMGSPSAQYTAVATVWGSIDIQRTSLMYEASTFVGKQIYRITIRFRPDIVFDGTYRLQYTSSSTGIVHTYEIQGVVNDLQSDVMLMLLCYELGGQQ